MVDDFDPSTRPSKRRRTYASGRTILNSSPSQSALSNISGVISSISDRLLGRSNAQKPGQLHDDSAYGSKEDSLNEDELLVVEGEQENVEEHAEEEETRDEGTGEGARNTRFSSRKGLERRQEAQIETTKRMIRASEATRQNIKKRISAPAILAISDEGLSKGAEDPRRSSRRAGRGKEANTPRLQEENVARKSRGSATKGSTSASQVSEPDVDDGEVNDGPPSQRITDADEGQTLDSEPRSSGRTTRLPKRFLDEAEADRASLATQQPDEVVQSSTSAIMTAIKSPPQKGILTPSRRKRDGPRKSVVFDEGRKEAGDQLGFKDIDTSTKKARTVKYVDSVNRSQPDEIPETPQQNSADEADIFLDRNPPQDILQSLEVANSQSKFSSLPEDSPQITSIKSIVLSRLTSTSQPLPPTPHLNSAYTTLHSLLSSTITSSESNSLLLLGSRGFGKTYLINSAITDLTTKHSGDFHVVRLNGFFQTDDRLALREIWRQLGRERQGEVDEDEMREVEGGSYADTMASLLSLLSHPDEFEQTPLRAEAMELDGPNPNPATTRTSKSIIIILDEFDLFTLHPRQTLLYNLFDIAQSKKAPIAVVGCSTRMDVVECLEKRVKSRFSHRWVHVPSCKSVEGMREVLEGILCVDVEGDEDEERQARERWNHHIKSTFLPSPQVQSLLNSIFYTTKSLPSLLSALYIPIASLSIPSTESNSDFLAAGTTIANTSIPVANTAIPQSSSPSEPTTKPKPRSKSKSKSKHTTTEPDLLASTNSDPTATATQSFSLPITIPSTLPPSQLTTLLPTLPTLHLSLLISATRLETLFSLPHLNFNAVYTHFLDLLGRSKQGQGSLSTMQGSTPGMRIWSRETCLSAWEDLGRWEVLLPATGGGRGGDEEGALWLGGREEASVRMVRVDVSLKDVAWAVGVKFTGGNDGSGGGGGEGLGKGIADLLRRWCREE